MGFEVTASEGAGREAERRRRGRVEVVCAEVVCPVEDEMGWDEMGWDRMGC